MFTRQGMMSRSMYSKSLDERLLEIAGIGFLIVAMARTIQCYAVCQGGDLNPKLYKEIQHFGRLPEVRAS